jgi:hypothetical protein
LFWIFLLRLSEFFVFTSFQKKKATGIAKKSAAEGKNFCFPGLTTAMLGLTTATFIWKQARADGHWAGDTAGTTEGAVIELNETGASSRSVFGADKQAAPSTVVPPV